eukprot:TRINITY_DN9187_c0_g1_i1.p2 TRINITY_DN9187_c0_g1~~TRINITY_DN9187_c0_g1_i1.p2  ORF type:complete len:246 (+),score=89.37 TRINITY_DN9187_c0_g1_i1:132-869(+)
MEAMGLAVKRRSDEAAGRAPKSGRGKADGGKGSTAEQAAQSMAKLVKDIGRLAVTTSREVAHLKAAVVTVLLFSREEGKLGAKLFSSVKDVTAAYMETTRALPAEKRREYVSPHIFVWRDFLENYKNVAQDKATGVAIEKYLQVVVAESKELATSLVPQDEAWALRLILSAHLEIFKINKCFDPKLARMEFAARNQVSCELFNLVLNDMKKNKDLAVQVRTGAAPKGDLERRVSAQVFEKQQKDD